MKRRDGYIAPNETALHPHARRRRARLFSFKPDGAGPWPAVIFYMDAPAIRPAMFQMSQRLADHGYFVLLPDMFWRVGLI